MRAGATIRRAGANHIVDCCGLANRAGARVPFRRSMTLPSSPTSRERLPVSGQERAAVQLAAGGRPFH